MMCSLSRPPSNACMTCKTCHGALTKVLDKPPIVLNHFGKSSRLIGTVIYLFRRCKRCKVNVYIKQIALDDVPVSAWPPYTFITELEYIQHHQEAGQQSLGGAGGSQYSKRVSRGADTYPSEYG